MPFFNNITQLLRITLINLVDEQEYRNLHFLNLFQEFHVLFRVFYHISHIKQHISIRQCTLREGKHHLLHLVIRFQNTRSIRKYNLHIISIHNTHDTMTGCLSLKSCNTNTFTHQLIHQGTFSHIRVTYYINETSFMHKKLNLAKFYYQEVKPLLFLS